MWWTNIGSISSRCWGKEPALFEKTLGDRTRKDDEIDSFDMFPSNSFPVEIMGGGVVLIVNRGRAYREIMASKRRVYI